jgi:fido (protein-threonine AMPylation protein)
MIGHAHAPGATPMDPNEIEGLIPRHITLKHELDEFEQAARLHHRLVLIHPFPNGNGRHARLSTDVFLRFCRKAPFSWGQTSLIEPSATRSAYIAALQAADDKDYRPLLAFVRT